MTIISYENITNAIYEPYDPKYQNIDSLNKELNRTFDLCNSCRMCFKYCPSFPSLFSAMDRTDANVLALKKEEKEKVIDECYQCGVCYIVCPYTETDEHPYKIDFPALMLRYKITTMNKKRLKLRDKLFADPDFLGQLHTGLISILVNQMMISKLFRRLLAPILDIHKNKMMPKFHLKNFKTWFRQYKKKQKTNSLTHNYQDKVILFPSCSVNYNNPQVGKDTIAVLEKNNIAVEYPPQNCCGMPALLGSTDIGLLKKKMKGNIKTLLPYVENGYKILCLDPSCSSIMKKEYPRFLEPGEWREKGEKISRAAMDIHEYLLKLKKAGTLNQEFKSSPKKVAYHVPCRLRVQNIGFPSRDIMRLIPETKVIPVAECCSHNGTWAMKNKYFPMSIKAGKRAFSELKEQNADILATDCPLAAIQLKQGMKIDKEPIHPIQVLAAAYKKPDDGGHPSEI